MRKRKTHKKVEGKTESTKGIAVSKRHPLFGWMKGTVQIAPRLDLTQPACPEWADLLDDQYGAAKQFKGPSEAAEQSPSPSMTVEEFKASLAKSKPPARQSPALVALWWAGKDDWKKAHAIVMDESGAGCAWVHAHLHRAEGDLENARYWYRQAKRPVATGSLAQEWDDIAGALLGPQ